jgi:hypothetical protein
MLFRIQNAYASKDANGTYKTPWNFISFPFLSSCLLCQCMELVYLDKSESTMKAGV